MKGPWMSRLSDLTELAVLLAKLGRTGISASTNSIGCDYINVTLRRNRRNSKSDT
jgi:hypothetical protein